VTDDYQRGRRDAEKHLLELNRRILANPHDRGKIIVKYYDELVLAGDFESAKLVLTYRAIAMANGEQHTVPAWFMVAGVIFGALTLLFFMTFLIVSMFHPVPPGSRFLVLIVLALGTALSSAFLGGTAAAAGRVPYLQGQPNDI